MPGVDEVKTPRVGVVLGGEGIKAFAALPLIQFLKRHDIEPELIVGCSGGALMAGLLAAGYDLADMAKHFARATDKLLYSDVDEASVQSLQDIQYGSFHVHSGILKPHKLQKIYQALFKELRLEDVQPKTVLMTTDILTGELIPLQEGNLADIVYASGAVYPLMPPARIGTRMLMDGGFKSPLPLMEAVKRDIDLIIGVYFEDMIEREPDGFLECYFNATKIYRQGLIRSQIPFAIDMHTYEIVNLYIRHNSPLEIWEAGRIQEILHQGKLAVQDQGEQILLAYKQFHKCG